MADFLQCNVYNAVMGLGCWGASCDALTTYLFKYIIKQGFRLSVVHNIKWKERNVHCLGCSLLTMHEQICPPALSQLDLIDFVPITIRIHISLFFCCVALNHCSISSCDVT